MLRNGLLCSPVNLSQIHHPSNDEFAFCRRNSCSSFQPASSSLWLFVRANCDASKIFRVMLSLIQKVHGARFQLRLKQGPNLDLRVAGSHSSRICMIYFARKNSCPNFVVCNANAQFSIGGSGRKRMARNVGRELRTLSLN